MLLEADLFLKDYLAVAPIPLALIRAIDCRHLSHVDWKGRILDLGCGDGLFASILFRHQMQYVDTGVDFDLREIKKAQKSGMYKHLIHCSITNMPLETGSFDMVLSNSVLEHIPHIEKAIAEVSRVLKPGGYFVFTVPSEHLSKQMFFPKVFKKIGLNFLANQYINIKNSAWKHYHLYSPDLWMDKLSLHGLKTLHYHYIHPKAVTELCDLFSLTGAISICWRKLFDRLLLFPNPIREKVLFDFVKKKYYLDSDIGSTIFMISQKMPIYNLRG